ncbi:MAG: class I SAM-dependent methyltransferase [candidate division Zixibacteria bacterium]|nr:class I SAM-dependent methyltransferase [candidate division Zixibacteria bacterium]
MKNRKTIVDYYRARAPEYEQIYYRDVPKRRQEIADHFEFVEKLAAGKSVLELACGSGYWTQAAAKNAKEVIATDIAPEMIKEAQNKKYNSPVTFINSDIHNLPFKKAEFDLIIIGFWFSHEPKQNYSRFFEIIQKPLKADGQIWLIDNNPPAEGAKSDFLHSDESGNNFKRRRLDDGEEFSILKNYFTGNELLDLFSKPFRIKQLTHDIYYWSVLLEQKKTELPADS